MTQPSSAPDFLSAVKGFTPVIDVLAQETSQTTAAVYGVVRRYCQMDEGVCRASVANIARRLGIHPKTARRHLKKLCKLGYLEDTTPERHNLPHVYRNTGESKILALVQARAPDPAPEPDASALETPAEPPANPTDPDRSPELSQEGDIMPQEEDIMSQEGDIRPHQEDKTPHPGRTKRPPKKPHEDSSTKKKGTASASRRAARQDANAVTSRHPAIRIFRSNAHRYPSKSWFRDVAETVGEGPDDVVFWGRVVKAWVGSGYNPMNVRGMLDWYRRGEIPAASDRGAGRGSRGGRQTNLHRSIEAGVSLLQEEGEWPP
jgi:hypothetical protein